jgi:predicted nucleotidyltransferase
MQSILLDKIRIIKERYKDDGIEIVGLFGSVARGDDDLFSDVDITYKIDYELFFKKYQDGFSQILKINEIKEALEKELKRRVDFIPLNSSNKSLKKEIKRNLVYV